jgi:hypothetical protein
MHTTLHLGGAKGRVGRGRCPGCSGGQRNGLDGAGSDQRIGRKPSTATPVLMNPSEYLLKSTVISGSARNATQRSAQHWGSCLS